MVSEATKERKDEDDKAGFGCCPENFREMFSTMAGCCVEKDNLPDCAEFMSRMRAGCCGPEGGGRKK